MTTNILYDNSTYQIVQVKSVSGPGTSPYWSAVPGDYPAWASGLSLSDSPSPAGGQVTHQSVTYVCGTSSAVQYTNWQFVDSHGTIHPFPSGIMTEHGVSGCPDEPTAQSYASDASGYWLEISDYNGAAVYDMYGNNVATGEDANGNFSPPTKDELNRNATGFPSGFSQAFTYLNIWTKFNSVGEELGPFLAQSPAISSITLPDGRKYSFQYDDAGPPDSAGVYASSQQGHYGTLTGITLPTGGQISITSTVIPAQYPDIYPAPLTVSQITTPAGTWTFNYSENGKITVTAPTDPSTGVAPQTTFTGVGSFPSQTVLSTYAGAASGTPLRTVTTTNPWRPTSITTTLDNGQSSHVDYTYTDQCTPRISTKKEYDFSGSLLRETDVSYFTSASDNTNLCGVFYPGTTTWNSPWLQTNRHIIAIPSSVKVYGPSGSSSTPIAETDYTYDSTSLSTESGSALNSVVGLPVHNDANFGASMTLRGNPTVISQMVSPGTFITTKTNYYNILGELVKTVDGNGNATNYDFTDRWSDSSCISSAVYAYPTTITNAKGQVSQFTYNSCDGSVASVKDPNDISAGRAGTVYTYDGRQRVTNISYPDGGNIATDYGGSTTPEVITATVTATPSPSQVSTTTLDGLGRTITTVAPNGAIVNTTYDAWGHLASVSNPHFSSSSQSDGTTTFGYDALGRKVQQTQPDQSSLAWSYSGSTTDSNDENNIHRQLTFDALGRLIKVMELGTTASPLSLETDYGYDALNNLLTVNQHGVSGEAPRTRNFTYDSLSRLTQAYNPESGWVCYGTTSGAAPNGSNCTSGYDANSNLDAKTVGRGTTSPYGVTTTYTYDALNRLTGKTYSDSTPPVIYHYDESVATWAPQSGLTNTIGRLSSASVGGTSPYSQYAYQYDAMGRETRKIFMMPNATGNAVEPGVGGGGDNFDLAGNIIFTDVGPGVYTYLTRDGAGHVSGITANKGSMTIFSQATYTPWGALSSRLLGNGLTETRTYDKRLRVASITQSKPGSTAGYSASIEYAPNGNVTIANDSVNGNWIYGYDSLNRLTNASSASGLNLAWSYDSFGNRWSQTASGSSGSAPQPSFTFTGNNNRTDPSNGLVYDAGGNVQVDNLNQGYAYDAEGRISTVSLMFGGMATYKYDSEGNLVYESGASGTQIFQRNTAGQAVFIYMPYPEATGPYYDYMSYVDGELIGTWENQAFRWMGKDWIDTKRYESTGVGDASTGIQPAYINSYTSLPFGDALSSIGKDPAHFTGKERDIESGLDYFGARYYSSSMGRFSSPDPSGLVYADPTNPQSLNLYSYVLNNPLKFTDPSGMACVWDDGSFDSEDDKQTGSSGQCGAAGGTWLDKGATASLSGGQDWSNKADSYIADAANFMSATVNPPAQGTNLLYDQQVATDQRYLAQRQAPSAPTSAQYIQAIQKAIAPIPNVCAFGAAAYLGVGGRGGLGLSADTRNGVQLAGSTSLVPGGSGVSFGGSSGNVNYAAPIPDTPFLAYVGTHNGDPNQIQSVGVGTATKSPLNVSMYADIGTFGDPNCR